MLPSDHRMEQMLAFKLQFGSTTFAQVGVFPDVDGDARVNERNEPVVPLVNLLALATRRADYRVACIFRRYRPVTWRTDRARHIVDR